MANGRDKLPPIEGDLRATLTQLHSAGANSNGQGVTFTELKTYLNDGPPQLKMGPGELRSLFLNVRKCVQAGLAKVVREPGNNGDGKSYFCLTPAGQSYAHNDNPPPGYSWQETDKYSASATYRALGRVPIFRGER